ncbi:MAG: hypothetical protein VB063_06800 [Bacteroides graminisolvens]|nr:hypothetical protein [Bacteroides graminisolvens]
MKQIDFQKTLENLTETGFQPVPSLVFVSIPEPRGALLGGLNFFTDNKAQWQPEYEGIAKWLENNNGRGLLCLGNCGRGKTLICWKIIPLLLHHYHRKIIKCYDAQQMNANIDEVKKGHILSIDDIGTENISIKYGEKRFAFPELVDEAEKKGKLLIVTTNLSIQELESKYGVRTVDRLKAITTPVAFIGNSLRK